jgi:hypothetical protein
LPDFSSQNIPKTQNVPNGHEAYQHFPLRPTKIYSNWYFLYENIPSCNSGQHGTFHPLRGHLGSPDFQSTIFFAFGVIDGPEAIPMSHAFTTTAQELWRERECLSKNFLFKKRALGYLLCCNFFNSDGVVTQDRAVSERM